MTIKFFGYAPTEDADVLGSPYICAWADGCRVSIFSVIAGDPVKAARAVAVALPATGYVEAWDGLERVAAFRVYVSEVR